ncbi:MAG: spore coat associated protein CotJA [Christensenellaceae bacterium]|nr:spore coat associated protein CotJA [Christensenellaceae bacterium]
MKHTPTPYIFSACRTQSVQNPARCNARETADHCRANPYARLYVKIEPYDNLACPSYALKNGTFFNDLYMPYIIPETACTCEK